MALEDGEGAEGVFAVGGLDLGQGWDWDWDWLDGWREDGGGGGC